MSARRSAARSVLLAALWLAAAPLAELRAAVVLQYHHVSDATPPSTSTAPERFAMHLAYLADNGFEVVPLQQLVDRLRAGQPLPDRTAAITFDDGYASIYTTAYPLLKKRGWPFTIFVNSAPHDRGQAGFMSWDQLRELSRNGATIANHTVSHPYLWRRQPGQDEAAWRAWATGELTTAQERIRQEIGSAPDLLAWPYGEYDEATLRLAAELGFTGFGQHSGPLAPYSDLRALPRFPFGGSYGDEKDFATKVRSLPMPLNDGSDPIRIQAASGEELGDIVLPGATEPPVLVLRFRDGFDTARLSCFASGGVRLPLVFDGPRVQVRATQPLPAGRSRYNCTAPSATPGRFHWLSQPWIVR